jgi:DNA invertase Pin-like site-specific DNA recombinase
VVVYKVDRLSRSLMDFARIIEVFDQNGASFVSVTQRFNTTMSIGRLTLNILLSFAQFERKIISERTRDKMSAARRKGKWLHVSGRNVGSARRGPYVHAGMGAPASGQAFLPHTPLHDH